jgi:hypothetical protein
VVTSRPEPTSGWPAFVAWSFCGVLWAVSVLSFVGLFTLPLAAVLTWQLIRSTTDRHDALGLVAGVAALFVFIGSAHIGEPPCPASGVLATPTGEGSASCTDFVSTPWLVAGVVLLVVVLVLYRMARSRHPEKRKLAAPS